MPLRFAIPLKELKMAAQAHEIVSKSMIKPSSPTPNHLRHFKISLLDQLSPPSFYVPIVLFYSASHINANFDVTNSKTISNKLKASLSQILTLYYPLCGRLEANSNSSVECNDDGVLFIESKVPIELSNFLKNPQVDEINELFPFDPYKVKDKETIGNMVVKLNEFSCGGIALATCFSHNIVDASTAASFLNDWALTTKSDGINELQLQQPHMDAASLFPPRDLDLDVTSGMISHENIATKRFVFDGTRISKLRENFGCFNPTRVEAVTALIWKTIVESSREQPLRASMVGHAVNFRSRMVSPLPLIFGNVWQYAISPVVKGGLELHDLGEMVRETIRKVNGDYISKFQGDEFVKVLEDLMEPYMNIFVKGIPCYLFTSWTRFDFYEADFGWGKPTWVGTSSVSVKNAIILMPTKNGGGIEAWITLSSHEMLQFERNPDLLQFASLT